MIKIYPVKLPVSGRMIEVAVERKPIKTCRLRVYPNAEVRMSAPRTVASRWLRNFLDEKSAWIEEKLEFVSKAAVRAGEAQFRDGASIKILGRDLRLSVFSVEEGGAEAVVADGAVLRISCRDGGDAERVRLLFDRWQRKEALAAYQGFAEKWYPVVAAYDIAMPSLRIKKMKTLWGSCNATRGVIYLNQYLFKAAPDCVEYVVLHELAHLLHPNHGKGFYDFLGVHMPDWKSRKRLLADYSAAHGFW
jgi:predicted metal-dependent hydrolase